MMTEMFSNLYRHISKTGSFFKWLSPILSLSLLFISPPSFTQIALNQDNDEFHYANNILIRDSDFEHAVKLYHWLDQIQLTDIGKEVIISILESGNQLVIYHSEDALLSAGVTGAPMTRKLTNGIGDDVYIKLYLDMDDEGTNCVLGKDGYYIEYTALQNIFHELSHARHKMRGTWLYNDSEGQAIREENMFRLQWSRYRYETYYPRHENIRLEDVVLKTASGCEKHRS